MRATLHRIFLTLGCTLLASCGGGSSRSTESSASGGGGSIAGTVGTENMGAARKLGGSTNLADGVKVYLWDARDAQGPRDSTRADTQGRFRFGNLGTGQWVVSVAQPDFGAISARIPLEGSADRVQNLSLDRWITGWVAVDTSRGAPTRAHILGIPGTLPLKPGFVQVRSLAGQKLELVLGDGSKEWSRLEILPVDGAPAVVGTTTSSWVPASEVAMRWDFNAATPLVSAAGRKATLAGGVSLRAVDAYQAVRFLSGTLAFVDSVTGPDTSGRWGLATTVWIDSLPRVTDSSLAVLADLGSGAFVVALQADGRLRLGAKRGEKAITSVSRSTSTFRLDLGRWTEIAASLERTNGFSLWVDGQKIPLDAPSVDTGAIFQGLGDFPRLTLGASDSYRQTFPGAIRNLSIFRSAPYVWK